MSSNYVCAYHVHEKTTAKEYMNLGSHPFCIPTNDKNVMLTVCKEHYQRWKDNGMDHTKIS